MNENEVILMESTKAELEAAGVSVEKIAELQNKTKQHLNRGASDEVLANLVKANTEAMTEFTQEVKAFNLEKSVKAESDKFDAVSAELIAKGFDHLASTDPAEANKLLESLSKDFGAGNVKTALSGNLKMLLERPISKSHPDFEKTKEFKKAFDYTYLLTAKFGGINKSSVGTDATDINWTTFKLAAKKLADQGLEGADMVLKAVTAALDTATTAEGKEWIPVALSSDLIENLYLDLTIANQYARKVMPTPVYDLPVKPGHAVAFGVPEALAPTDWNTFLVGTSIFDTAKTTLNAQKIGAMMLASYEIQDDSLIDIAAQMSKEVSRALAHGLDDAAMNGDTAGTLDSTLWTSAADVRKKFVGIRKGTNAGAKVDLSTLDLAGIRNLRKKMKNYGVKPDGLVIHVSPESYTAMLGFNEVVTMEKFGPQATVKVGELARVDNISINPTNYVYSNLNATGTWDGITTNKTLLVMSYRDAYVFGDRMTVKVETDRSVMSQQDLLVATWRGDFKKILPSGENTSAIGYNIAT